MMIELSDCPICGRKPKVSRLYYPTGAEVRIVCKPLFRKTHCGAISCAVSEHWAYQKAAEMWNNQDFNEGVNWCEEIRV